jgi:hypothetical protein
MDISAWAFDRASRQVAIRFHRVERNILLGTSAAVGSGCRLGEQLFDLIAWFAAQPNIHSYRVLAAHNLSEKKILFIENNVPVASMPSQLSDFAFKSLLISLSSAPQELKEETITTRARLETRIGTRRQESLPGSGRTHKYAHDFEPILPQQRPFL